MYVLPDFNPPLAQRMPAKQRVTSHPLGAEEDRFVGNQMIVSEKRLPAGEAVVSRLENLPQPVASKRGMVGEERISQVEVTRGGSVTDYDDSLSLSGVHQFFRKASVTSHPNSAIPIPE